MSSGKDEEAGGEFRRALDLAPSVPETWQTWVEYLARTNQRRPARDAIAAAKETLAPENAALDACPVLLVCRRGRSGPGLLPPGPPGPAGTGDPAPGGKLLPGPNHPDQAGPLLDKLLEPAIGASPADQAWAGRAQSMLGFAGGVNPERVEKALGLVEQSVASRPGDLDEQRLRAVLLSMRYSRRKESIRAFESMDEARRLGPREQFLLAMLYSSVRDWPRCRAEMLKILDSQPRQPRHMIFYVNLMIQLGELDEAERWLRILKPLIPAEEARVALELEARLLKSRKREPDLIALIRNHVNRNPDDVLPAAVLFERFGLARESEAAYRT